MTDYAHYNDSLTTNKIICPSQNEVEIYIHGASNDETSANEQFNRTSMWLASNNYTIPLMGFNWNSYMSLNENGWKTAYSCTIYPYILLFLFENLSALIVIIEEKLLVRVFPKWRRRRLQ